MNTRRSGILAHPTSLPSPYGIGDLGEGAYNFIDFLKKAGQSYWQILPLSHTGYGNSPYSSYSAFACNPMLISPDKLANDGFLGNEDLRNIPNFNENKVEYEKVKEYKETLFRKAFVMFKKYGDKKPFVKFCEDNADWLDDYTLFIAIKDYYVAMRKTGKVFYDLFAFAERAKSYMTEAEILEQFYGASFTSFPQELLTPDEAAKQQWRKVLKDEIEYYCFLQYEFAKQWAELKKYANKNGIQIIGDMPIFVSADSADAWLNRELFYYNEKGFPRSVAGVPPDYFSETGQLWGNPVYNWDYHKKTGYSWWVKRLKQTLKFVDVVRIDHFRAFESYWDIPYPAKTAIKGEWKKGPGKEFFDTIEQKLGSLPIIAEDLGDLNPEVHILRDELGLAGMKILQFAFDSGSGNAYLPHNYGSANWIVYTGTHDNNTTVGWWNDLSEEAKNHIKMYLNRDGSDISWDLIRLAFSSTAATAIIPLQDILCLDSSARMNTPGTASGNWEFKISKYALNDGHAQGLKLFSELYNRN